MFIWTYPTGIYQHVIPGAPYAACVAVTLADSDSVKFCDS